MTDKTEKRRGGLWLLAAMLPATAAFAQTAPIQQEPPRTIPGLAIGTATPAATQTPVPVPTEAVRGLAFPASTPSPNPMPRRTSASGPISVPTRTGAAGSARTEAPAPHAAPATPTPRPASDGSPTPQPVADPSPDATPARSVPAPPAPTRIAPSAPVPMREAGAANWPWIAAIALAVVIGGAWLLLRRRRPDMADDAPVPVADVPPAAMPVATPVAVVPATSPIGQRARVAIAFQPGRAGLNMLSAVVEGVVTVTNRGDASASDVRVHATLLSAHAEQEGDLAAAFAMPAGRPAVPPFTLAPGEERRVRIVAALPRDAVRAMEAGGRPMFVPLVAVDVRYTADVAASPGVNAQAFVVGIERVDSAKLAPFWLDAPLKMYDQIAARPQGAAIER